ncbi:MBL fold metallo-hydrolase [Gephyromycinifex aptenodytis]|uniref:MBL fold metallo-hydrolase n=1 Tax=Gephyromycinifex aptenodytis TaxID=2716227 RepID=UPI001446119B|nr:MBL fold metallo-hydrolase [Gephyromycinifex aptenodytis]
MYVTHLGHSCLLVEIADTRVLLDPGGFTPDFEQVRDLDAIIVTHQHPDHIDHERLPTLLAGNPQARLYAEPQTVGTLSASKIEAESLASGTPFFLGELRVEPVGKHHAVIHADIPRIDNVGVVLRAPGEPSLFHPGDALDADPGQVDVLCAPVNAPWCAMKETVDFVRRIGAARVVPIHDGLLQQRGRDLYLTQIGNLAGQKVAGLQITDAAGQGRMQLAV